MPNVARLTPQQIVDDLTRVLPPGHPCPTARLYHQRGGRFARSTIAHVVGSWRAAVEAWRTGVPPESRQAWTRRICLRCDRGFASEGPGHRICGPCKETEGWREASGTVYRLPRFGQRMGD